MRLGSQHRTINDCCSHLSYKTDTLPVSNSVSAQIFFTKLTRDNCNVHRWIHQYDMPAWLAWSVTLLG